MDDLAKAISANPSKARHLQEKGDVDAAMTEAATPLSRRYVWPYQMHASIGPSCAVADWQAGQLRVWSGTQNPHLLRADLARLMGVPPKRWTWCGWKRPAAMAALRRRRDRRCRAAVRAPGAPVRVQLTREQEHAWEPKGAGQLMEVDGALDAAGAALAYSYSSRYPSNGAPTLALLLTGKASNQAETWEMGDRTSIAPYDIPNMRVVIHDTPPIVRASWLRGVSALPNSFAHESWIDEAATMAGVDPVDYRLRYLTDKRGIAVVEATAERAGWTPHTRPQTLGRGDWLRGRGFAYALYVHSKFPGYGAAWAAWVADVAVNAITGEVKVEKVTVGHDAGLMINPDGVQHQIHGNVVQSTSRALVEQVPFDAQGTAALEWGNYPLITFPELPEIDVLMLPRPDEPPLGAGKAHRCRAPRRLPMRSMMPPASASANRPSPRKRCAPPWLPMACWNRRHRPPCPRHHPRPGGAGAGRYRAWARGWPRGSRLPLRGARRWRPPIRRRPASTAPRHSNAGARSPPPETAQCAIPRRVASPMPGRAMETPFGTIVTTNSRRTRKPGSVAGRSPPLPARCARASRAMATIFIPPFPIPRSPS
jgi:nicotinate dehydrogenase subunit B